MSSALLEDVTLNPRLRHAQAWAYAVFEKRYFLAHVEVVHCIAYCYPHTLIEP